MIDFSKHSSIPWLEKGTIFLTKHGSQAYGTALPTSDLDVKGVAIPPSEYLLGFHKKFEQAESSEPDMQIYDIRKFFNLAADCNPNIIEVLHTDPADWLIRTKWSDDLVANKDLFLSKKAKHTFSGYAVAQLKRIKTHRRWLLDPPDHTPNREEFKLRDDRPVSKEQLGAAKSMILKKFDLTAGEPGLEQQAAAAKKLGYDENFINYLQREQAYACAKREWDQYQGWLKTRNKARSDLEAKYGYDTKHGMHLVRLLRMCREILTTGKVIVKRPDAEELLAIRAGAWEYDRLLEWAESEDAAQELLAKESKLPHSPDRNKLDELCQKLVGNFLWPNIRWNL